MTARPHSLQGRLLALLLGVVMVVWSAAAVATWMDVRHELDELLDSHLAQAAALLVAQQTHNIEDNDTHPVDAPPLHRYAPQVAFQVWHEGRLALRSVNTPDLTRQGPDDTFRAGFRTIALHDGTWRVFAAYGAELDVQVYVGERIESRQSIVWAVLRSMFWPMALALPVLGLAAWWAVSQGLAPLRQLGRTLHERDPRALQAITLHDRPAEMTPMLDALNGLFGRIDTLMASERRFTADAAHELRTPIAAIRAQAQVAMAESDAALRRHALQSTLDGCDRATRLVEQLLTLSRLEAGAGPAPTRVSMAEVVRRICADLAPKALHKRQDLDVQADEAAAVQGDPTLLAVLLRNLVDNAIRYSPPGARVCVQLVRQKDGITLTVSDSGPGLGEADLQRLGERFFRVLGTGQDGSGLGWSIVRRIADAQGATIQVARSATLGGLEVQVAFGAPA